MVRTALLALIADPEPEVRLEATRALGRDARGSDLLRGALANESDPRVREALEVALGAPPAAPPSRPGGGDRPVAPPLNGASTAAGPVVVRGARVGGRGPGAAPGPRISRLQRPVILGPNGARTGREPWRSAALGSRV